MNQERPTTSARIINDEKSKQTLCSAKTTRTDATSRRLTNTRIVQNFHVVWLDADGDKMDKEDCHNQIIKLRQVVNTFNTFTDVDECTNFINDVKDDKVFMIVFDTLGKTVIPIVHDLPQMSSIYIFCENTVQHEEWSR